MQIFIAYAAADADAGARFVSALRAVGADVFVDAESFETEVLRRERGQRLESSDLFIVLLSQRALGASRLRALSSLFAASAQAHPTKRIIPVWLEPLTLERIWAPLARLHPISGSTSATFAVEHLIDLTLAESGLPPLPVATAVGVLAEQPTTPRLRQRPRVGRPVVLVAGVIVLLLGSVGSVLLLTRTGGARATTTRVSGAITPGATTVARVGGTATPARPGTTPTITASPSSVASPSPSVRPTASPTRTTPQPTATSTATTPSPTPTAGAVTSFNYANGFPSGAGMQLNGSASQQGGVMRLTDAANSESGTFYFAKPVDITHFKTVFQFNQNQGTADGLAFVIQGNGPNALGSGGNDLGYGGIGNSVAVKFDLWSIASSATESTTGLYVNGASPDTPDTSLANTLDLHSGHTMTVTVSYANAALGVTITDTVTGSSASQSYAIDIPATVGASQAYMGFTGGTGGFTATQDIQSWVLGG